MARIRPLHRRAALVELTRRPVPPDYDYAPKNREQRRHLARKLRRADAKKSER